MTPERLAEALADAMNRDGAPYRPRTVDDYRWLGRQMADALGRAPRVRQAPESVYDCRCATCSGSFADPGSARRHAREQRHRVHIVEVMDLT